ncbi:uncharacterized protein LOC34622468 [Cyclospora cayetanensis]|uniref:Uncharacterized protein LOC34622468 n=1 Tax=Cyclospora cayetanensis TaxID=88456 RepID=A0A6P6RYJ5_9EIME|nr:uncharacterized protein LOC34622468 [Cyclospora cayetanensis]
MAPKTSPFVQGARLWNAPIRAGVAEYWDSWSDVEDLPVEESCCHSTSNAFLLVPPEWQQGDQRLPSYRDFQQHSNAAEVADASRQPKASTRREEQQETAAFSKPQGSKSREVAPKKTKSTRKATKAASQASSEAAPRGSPKAITPATVGAASNKKRAAERTGLKRKKEKKNSAVKQSAKAETAQQQALQHEQQKTNQEQSQTQSAPLMVDSQGRSIRLLPSGRYELMQPFEPAAPVVLHGEPPSRIKVHQGSFKGIAGIHTSETGAFVRRLPQRLPNSAYPRLKEKPAIPVKVRLLRNPSVSAPKRLLEQIVEPPKQAEDGCVHFQLYQVQHGDDREHRRVIAYSWKEGQPPIIPHEEAYPKTQKEEGWGAAAIKILKSAFNAGECNDAAARAVSADAEKEPAAEETQEIDGKKAQEVNIPINPSTELERQPGTEDQNVTRIVPACEVLRPKMEMPLPGRQTGHVPVKIRVIRARKAARQASALTAPLTAPSAAIGLPTPLPVASTPVRFALVQVQSKGDRESRRLVAFRPAVHSQERTQKNRQRHLTRIFDYGEEVANCEAALERICMPRDASQGSMESAITMSFEYRASLVKQQNREKGLAVTQHQTEELQHLAADQQRREQDHHLMLLHHFTQQQKQQKERQVQLDHQEKELKMQLERLQKRAESPAQQQQKLSQGLSSNLVTPKLSHRSMGDAEEFAASRGVSGAAFQVALRAAARVAARRAAAAAIATTEQIRSHPGELPSRETSGGDRGNIPPASRSQSQLALHLGVLEASEPMSPKQNAADEQESATQREELQLESARYSESSNMQRQTPHWSIRSNCGSLPQTSCIPEETCNEARPLALDTAKYAECWLSINGSCMPSSIPNIPQNDQEETVEPQEQREPVAVESSEKLLESTHSQTSSASLTPQFLIRSFEVHEQEEHQAQEGEDGRKESSRHSTLQEETPKSTSRSLPLKTYEVKSERSESGHPEGHLQQLERGFEHEPVGAPVEGEYGYSVGSYEVGKLQSPVIETQAVPLEALSPEDQELVRQAVMEHLQQQQSHQSPPQGIHTPQLFVPPTQVLYISDKAVESAAAAATAAAAASTTVGAPVWTIPYQPVAVHQPQILFLPDPLQHKMLIMEQGKLQGQHDFREQGWYSTEAADTSIPPETLAVTAPPEEVARIVAANAPKETVVRVSASAVEFFLPAICGDPRSREASPESAMPPVDDTRGPQGSLVDVLCMTVLTGGSVRLLYYGNFLPIVNLHPCFWVAESAPTYWGQPIS